MRITKVGDDWYCSGNSEPMEKKTYNTGSGTATYVMCMGKVTLVEYPSSSVWDQANDQAWLDLVAEEEA